MRLRHREVLIVFLVNKRKKIDKLDYLILELLTERLTICEKIGEYKKKYQLPITDSTREKRMLQDRYQFLINKGQDNQDLVNDLYNVIFRQSKKLQENLLDTNIWEDGMKSMAMTGSSIDKTLKKEYFDKVTKSLDPIKEMQQLILYHTVQPSEWTIYLKESKIHTIYNSDII
jgi:chorismate mutase